MKWKDPKGRPRACLKCGFCEGDPQYRASSCKHKWVNWETWAIIGVIDLYDIRSENTAMRCFAESCGGEPVVEPVVAIKLNSEDIHLLRTGKARLKITLETEEKSADV